MHRSKLRNRYNKNKTEDNFIAYKTKETYVWRYSGKTKRKYYGNLDLKDLPDNRKFWKTVKLVFRDTVQVNKSVTLIEKGEFASEDLAIVEVFNHYINSITKELEISENETHLSSITGICDPIYTAITKYKEHPSIIKRLRKYWHLLNQSPLEISPHWKLCNR